MAKTPRISTGRSATDFYVDEADDALKHRKRLRKPSPVEPKPKVRRKRRR